MWGAPGGQGALQQAGQSPPPPCPPLLAPSAGCLQEVLQRHQGDRNSLIVALTKLRNDEKKLEADAEGLNSMVQLLMQVRWGRQGRGAGRRSRPPPGPPPLRRRYSSARAAAA